MGIRDHVNSKAVPDRVRKNSDTSVKLYTLNIFVMCAASIVEITCVNAYPSGSVKIVIVPNIRPIDSNNILYFLFMLTCTNSANIYIAVTIPTIKCV